MEKISLIRRLSQLGTRVETYLYGHLVGRDDFGNSYYRSKKTPKGVREKRWVLYLGEPEASKVPPEWHIWLHHTTKDPLPADSVFRQPWQIPYQENKTGTDEAYMPSGHTLSEGQRSKATGDYEAWRPD